MYLPFLRGKQFELIALREQADYLKENSSLISPIIEPVRTSSSTIRLTLEALVNNNINFTIVLNPIEGKLKDKSNEIIDQISDFLTGYNNFQCGLYIKEEKSIEENLEICDKITFDFNGFSFIHLAPINYIKRFNDFVKIKQAVFNIIHFGHTSRRYYRNFPQETWVSLDDYFQVKQKNVDYNKITDEFFTDENKFYEQEGFVGFSDYLTIGEEYSDTGFLPYAVAIHLTYADDNNNIRIHHFVSDSNDDTSDVAGKFLEALIKLIGWVDENDIEDSIAIQEFRRLWKEERFPGLGYVKKLSIMHHIEVVINTLKK